MTAVMLAIPPNIGIHSLGSFADKLIASLAMKDPVCVDISTMTTSDPSALQLIVQLIAAARRHAVDINTRITLAGPPTPALVSVLERGGFMAGTHEDLEFWCGDQSQ